MAQFTRKQLLQLLVVEMGNCYVNALKRPELTTLRCRILNQLEVAVKELPEGNMLEIFRNIVDELEEIEREEKRNGKS